MSTMRRAAAVAATAANDGRDRDKKRLRHARRKSFEERRGQGVSSNCARSAAGKEKRKGTRGRRAFPALRAKRSRRIVPRENEVPEDQRTLERGAAKFQVDARLSSVRITNRPKSSPVPPARMSSHPKSAHSKTLSGFLLGFSQSNKRPLRQNDRFHPKFQFADDSFESFRHIRD